LIIDFPNRFEERKDPVLDIPEEEISKLCGKAVKLIPELLDRGSFTNEGSLEQRKAKYQEKSSVLAEFVRDYCFQMDGAFITCSEFIELFREFCKDNGYAEKSAKFIGKEMSDIGFPSVQKKVRAYNQRVYLNLRWKRGIADDDSFPI
jgi:phage/plasmid-associated DNA primase